MKPCIAESVYIQTSVTLIYMVGIYEVRDSQSSFITKGELLDNHLGIGKHVQTGRLLANAQMTA